MNCWDAGDESADSVARTGAGFGRSIFCDALRRKNEDVERLIGVPRLPSLSDDTDFECPGASAVGDVRSIDFTDDPSESVMPPPPSLAHEEDPISSANDGLRRIGRRR